VQITTNIHGGRKLYGLSEYVISFKTIWFYSDNIFEILTATIFFRGYIINMMILTKNNVFAWLIINKKKLFSSTNRIIFL
jgi:hypothetical protein